MARVLITGGRAPVSLDLARYLSWCGHEVFVAESQQIQLSRLSRAVQKTFSLPPPRFERKAFMDRLVEIVQDENIDLLIPTCEEVFHISRDVHRLRPMTRVLTDHFAKIDRLHDKWRFQQWAGSLGLSVPESHLIISPAQLRSMELSGDWVLKPAYSRFGGRVLIGTLGELIAENPQISADKPWVLQRRIVGRDVCAYMIASKGRLLALSIYSHSFTAGGAGICFEEVDRPDLERSLRAFAMAIEADGQMAFDFIEQADGQTFALECNPRATSGLHLLLRQPGMDKILLENSGFVRAPFGTRAMLLLAMVLMGLGQVRSIRKFQRWFATVFTAKEAVFSWRDPLPFFDQLICFADLMIRSRKNRLSLLDTSTRDIEWNGAEG